MQKTTEFTHLKRLMDTFDWLPIAEILGKREYLQQVRILRAAGILDNESKNSYLNVVLNPTILKSWQVERSHPKKDEGKKSKEFLLGQSKLK